MDAIEAKRHPPRDLWQGKNGALRYRKAAYLRHIIQAVEDVLASLLGLDPRFTLVVLWSLRETRSRCSSQIPSHFPSGNALFTFGSLQPLVVDVQQDSAYPVRDPGVAHKYSSNSQEKWEGGGLHMEAHNISQTLGQYTEYAKQLNFTKLHSIIPPKHADLH